MKNILARSTTGHLFLCAHRTSAGGGKRRTGRKNRLVFFFPDDGIILLYIHYAPFFFLFLFSVLFPLARPPALPFACLGRRRRRVSCVTRVSRTVYIKWFNST